MKKLVVVVMAIGLAFGAYAQKGRGPVNTPRQPQRTVIVRSYPMYSPFWGGYGRAFGPWGMGMGFGPYGYGYGFDNGFRYQNRPTKLDMRVEDIKNDYQDRILSVRMDDELSRKEKRNKIRVLKVERDREINDVRKNYYKSDPRV